jgi:hypothetical protein
MRAAFIRPLFLLTLLLWAPLASAVLPIEHWVSSRGTRVYFVRADSIPMLDISIDFDAGARHDPPRSPNVWPISVPARAPVPVTIGPAHPCEP